MQFPSGSKIVATERPLVSSRFFVFMKNGTMKTKAICIKGKQGIRIFTEKEVFVISNHMDYSIAKLFHTKIMSLTPDQQSALLTVLQTRFDAHMSRHQGLTWDTIQARLESHPAILETLSEMEDTGGEPDVIGQDPHSRKYIFCDCSPQSPSGRRSLCYDRKALDDRKEYKPKDSAHDMAKAMGIELLTEEEYRSLQMLGEFDTKTSSWVVTPGDIRKLGGAIFADRRYNTVFIYHNGAESYYASRGFRGKVEV